MPKFQFFHQYDAMDCGSASIRMITNYYGKDFSLEYLRTQCYTTREGVSLRSISETLENVGFKTVGGRISFEKLTSEALLPCILHWDQEHFVVLHKTQKSKFRKKIKLHIADPGKGLLVFNEKDFKEHWLSTRTGGEDKGIVLLVEPTAAFYEQRGYETERTGLKFLFSYFSKYRRFFGQLIIGLVLGSLFQLLFPFLTQSIVDKGIVNKNIAFIYVILAAQLMLILSRAAVEFIRRWILLHISTRINVTLISDFFIKLMKLPMSYFDSKLTGDIIQRIEDHRRVQNFLTARSLSTLFSFLNLLVFGVVLWAYSLKIFLLFLLGSGLYALWVSIFLRKRKKLDYKRFELYAKEQSLTYQLIQGMQEIKLQNVALRKRWEWEDIQAELFYQNIDTLKLEQKQEAGNILINETKNIIITIVAALSVIHGEMTLGMMLAVQYIIGQLSLPVEQMVALIYDMQDTRISLERINEIHQQNDEDKNRRARDDAYIPENHPIIVSGLMFQYSGPSSPEVLKNIDFEIPPCKVTAIVGASGSGKTTLIKLLLQYYPPTTGSIKIGETDLQSFNSVSWRNRCGAVMQDGFIFSESIARNIATSADEIDLERLLHAAELANIHDFIQSLPLGYNTVIGNEGQNLSQGQRQRILIARAIYKDPDFLFLDEATNALDANNEKVIVTNLQQFYRNKTVVIVAHRLSTVKNADQIIVLEKGEIVEKGTHEELTFKKGAYFNLVKNQLELGN